MSVNNHQYKEQSHMGYLMKAGDVCVGYDLKETQFVSDEAESLRSELKLPNVVILRKLYGAVAAGETNAVKRRMWRLQRLDVAVAETAATGKGVKNAAEADEMDEEDFLQEVEADKDMRMNMNVYKSDFHKRNAPAMMGTEGDVSECEDGEDDEDDQQITLDELLDGLVLHQGPEIDMVDPQVLDPLVKGEKAAKDGIRARNICYKDAAVPVSSGWGNQFPGGFVQQSRQKPFNIDVVSPALTVRSSRRFSLPFKKGRMPVFLPLLLLSVVTLYNW